MSLRTAAMPLARTLLAAAGLATGCTSLVTIPIDGTTTTTIEEGTLLEDLVGDLSFLQSMDLSVSAPDLDEVLVASADAFPEGQSEVDFALEDVDLTDYATSQSMTLSTDVTGNRPEVDPIPWTLRV